MNNQLPVVHQVRGAMEKMQGDFRSLLPDHISVDAFTRVAQTALQLSPDLQECSPKSFLAACTKAAEAGLLPDGEQGAIVAYNVKVKTRDGERWEKQSRFMPMVQGLRDLVRRSGQVKDWKARLVYEGDIFEYVDGDEERLVHKPAFEPEARLLLVYSIAYLENGEISRCVMRIDEVERIRKRSRSGGSGPWSTDYEQMVIKTCLRRHYKSLPRAKDDMMRQRISSSIRAFDDAEGVIDLTPATAQDQPPQISIAERSAAALQRATELTAFDDGTGEIQQPAPATKPRAKRKSPSERLAEANAGNGQNAPSHTAGGNAHSQSARATVSHEGNGRAAPTAAPATASGTQSQQSKASTSGSASSASHAHTSSQDDDGFESQDPGSWEPDYEPASDAQVDDLPAEEAPAEEFDGEDPIELAYRQGWHARFAMKVRTPPAELRGEKELITAYQQGWDVADKTAKLGNAPKTAEASEAMLDSMVQKVFI